MQRSDENIKMTRQRKVILDVLEKSDRHPTVDELYELVRKKLPRISIATVYRNLEALSDAGMVQKLEFAGCQKRFDKTVINHYHIRCLDCGKVEDLPPEPSEGLQEEFVPETKYEIVGFRLEFMGYCPDCRKKKRKR